MELMSTVCSLRDRRDDMISQLTELMAFIERLMRADSNVSQVEVLCESFQKIVDMFVDTNIAIASQLSGGPIPEKLVELFIPRAKTFWTFVENTKNWCTTVKNKYVIGPAEPEKRRFRVFEEDVMPSSFHVSQANTTFCLDLFKQLSDNNKTANVFFSPVSISSALALVMLGARGDTATQMSEVLRFKAADVHTKFKRLHELIKANVPYVLSVANRLYGEQSLKFVKDFLEKSKYRNVELETADFQINSEAARLHINSWVAKQTQGKIKDLLEKGAVNSLTKLVLVNAIYFRGTWKDEFDKGYTRDAHFRLNKTDTKPVKMMHLKKTFLSAVVSEPHFQILELPYVEGGLSMLIFLPMDIEDSSTGLEQLEKELTYERFRNWTSRFRPTATEIHVALPRFKIEEKYDMKDVLVSMGMVDAFDAEKSDFSGMSSANNLVLSKIIHKACVDVNEEGTEAAAASITRSEASMASASPQTFTADHPFLFFICRKPPFWEDYGGGCAILFAGRYCSPE